MEDYISLCGTGLNSQAAHGGEILRHWKRCGGSDRDYVFDLDELADRLREGGICHQSVDECGVLNCKLPERRPVGARRRRDGVGETLEKLELGRFRTGQRVFETCGVPLALLDHADSVLQAVQNR